MTLTIDEIVDRSAFANDPDARSTQLIQTAYRQQLVDLMPVTAGEHILEIACGQGDMTAVLANAVGSSGGVTAVDIADPLYGAPVNLGDAMAAITASDLGGRIDARFRCDLLDPAVTFPRDAFDVAVIAHGAWYFDAPELLEATLRRVREWTDRLVVVEWDMQPNSLNQVAHLLAVLIQGQLAAWIPENDANVRTPLSISALRSVIVAAGWSTTSAEHANTTGLQDAGWEIDMAETAMDTVADIAIPGGQRIWLESQRDVMRSLAGTHAIEPLPAYVIRATRAV